MITFALPLDVSGSPRCHYARGQLQCWI